MGRAVALIAWVWGLALSLVAYYVAVSTWSAQELFERLGEQPYNTFIPLGGWRAVVLPTLVFVAVLALVSMSRRGLASAAEWLERRASVPRRAGLVALHLLLIALAVPALHAGIAGARDGITGAIDRRRWEQAAVLGAAESERRFALEPFCTGEGMGPIVTAFEGSYGFGGERLLLDSDGLYRRTTWGCYPYDGRSEGRYEREDGLLVLQPPTWMPQPTSDTWPCDADGSPLAIRLHDVRWGGRRYLVPEWQLEFFCMAINEGTEPRERGSGRFLMRDGDATLLVTGRPALPAPWTDRVLESPLEGRTLAESVGDGLWVDLGRVHGLREGMQLFLAEAPLRAEFRERWGGRSRIPQELKVVELEARRSRMAFVHPGQAMMLLAIPAGSVVTSHKPQAL
jgi:hypothetical protein